MMDGTVIQEIANQLGMTVDQAGQFVTTYLPDYAALECMQCTVPLAILSAVTLLLVTASLVALVVFIRAYCQEREKGISESRVAWMRGKPLVDDFGSFWVFFVTGCVAVVLLLALAITLGNLVPQIIGWQSYPEAMLIDQAVKAIGA